MRCTRRRSARAPPAPASPNVVHARARSAPLRGARHSTRSSVPHLVTQRPVRRLRVRLAQQVQHPHAGEQPFRPAVRARRRHVAERPQPPRPPPSRGASTIRAWRNASHSSHRATAGRRARRAPHREARAAGPPRPPATRASRSAARLAAASGSRTGSPGPRAGRRTERPASHSATHEGGSPSPTPPSARSSNNASACLHGIFRLGQEHLKAGPSASTATSYGREPLPRQSPQTARSSMPVSLHGAGRASLRAALTDDASGASASTVAAVHSIDQLPRALQGRHRHARRRPPRGRRSPSRSPVVAFTCTDAADRVARAAP